MKLLREMGYLDFICKLDLDSSWTHAVLPSQWVKLLLAVGHREFQLRLGADATVLKQFWTEFLKSPLRRGMAAQHRWLKDRTAEDLMYSFPVTTHEDTGPVTKLLGANCLSFSGLLGRGPEKVTKFLIASAVKQWQTDTKVWQTILDDFDMLARDGFLGSFSQRWHAIYLCGRVDEEVRSNDYGAASSSTKNPCSECNCDRSGVPFTDLRASARWRPTEIRSLPEYKAKMRGGHPLVESHYFTRFMFPLDTMHQLECRGVANLVYCSTVTRLVVTDDDELGPNQQARLDRINALLEE